MSDRDGGAELFVMNADGSDQTRLTTTDVGEAYGRPAWSPDGHRLAFLVYEESCGPPTTLLGGAVCTNQMYVVGAGGSGQQRFGGANDYDPAWSHTGLLAFGSEEGLVVERAGKRRLLLHAGGPPASPSWSPDSRWIVYDNGGELEITRPDGTGWRVLTPYHFPRENTEPAWSPDGRTIAFSRVEPRTEPIYTPRPASIYTVRPDGTGLRKLKLNWRG
jgi:Tol biopolymer transport system component